MEDLNFTQNDESSNSLSKKTKLIEMTWKPQDDIFSVEQYSSLAQEDILMTKRSIGSIVPKIYDINGTWQPLLYVERLNYKSAGDTKTPTTGKL